MRHQMSAANGVGGAIAESVGAVDRSSKNDDAKQLASMQRLVVPIAGNVEVALGSAEVACGRPHPTDLLPGPETGRPNIAVGAVTPIARNPKAVRAGRGSVRPVVQ